MSDFTSAFYLMWLIGAMLAFLVFYYVCKGVLRFFARPSRLSSDSCYRVCVQGHHKDYGYNIYQNFYKINTDFTILCEGVKTTKLTYFHNDSC